MEVGLTVCSGTAYQAEAIPAANALLGPDGPKAELERHIVKQAIAVEAEAA